MYFRQSSLKQQKFTLTFQEARSLKSRSHQEWLIFEALRENLSHAFLLASGSPWPSLACRGSAPFRDTTFPWCSPCASVSEYLSSKATSPVGSRTPPPNSSLTSS